jgi:hypothetical protein
MELISWHQAYNLFSFFIIGLLVLILRKVNLTIILFMCVFLLITYELHDYNKFAMNIISDSNNEV